MFDKGKGGVMWIFGEGIFWKEGIVIIKVLRYNEFGLIEGE